MKIAISSKGNTLESKLDSRFGRAAFFIIVDTETMKADIIDNSSNATAGGAGITAAQTIIDAGVEGVITGNVGPNAMNVLKAGDIKIYKGSSVTIKENVESLKKGLLDEIKTTVPQHFGLKGGQK